MRPASFAVTTTLPRATGNRRVFAATPSAASAPVSSPDGPRVMSYLALTLAVGWALRAAAADTACSWCVSTVQEELGSLVVGLRALFVPWNTPANALQDPQPFAGPRRSQTSASPHEVLLADAVVRRGPPRRRRPWLPDASAAARP